VLNSFLFKTAVQVCPNNVDDQSGTAAKFRERIAGYLVQVFPPVSQFYEENKNSPGLLCLDGDVYKR